MEAQRKKKPGRLRRRMRGALAKFQPTGRRLSRDHVTDDAQQLVSNEQQPEVELGVIGSAKPEVVYPPSDRPAKKKPTIFAKFRNIKSRFRRRKTSSISDGKSQRNRKSKMMPERDSTSRATSCSGVFESEVDRLVEVDEPEVETTITDGVTSAEAAILHNAEPEEVKTAGDGEKVKLPDRPWHDKIVEREEATIAPTDQPEVDDITQQQGDTRKRRKKKRAKRYAKRAGVRAWKGIRSSWKFLSSSLVMLKTTPVITLNPTSTIVQAWQDWQSHGTSNHHGPTTNVR